MTLSLEDASHLYEVKHRNTYAQRDGFRIRELCLVPPQEVPWHRHSNISDTFYVLEGELRIELRAPDDAVRLQPGRTFEVAPGRPHRVTSASAEPVTFLILQGLGIYDYVPLDQA